MTPAEQFEELLLKERTPEAIPFLAALDTEGKKGVAKKLKALNYIWENEPVPNHKERHLSYPTTRPRGTEEQKRIFTLGAFFCYGKKEFFKLWGHRYFDKATFDQILPLYTPSWFNDYVNNFHDRGWAPVNLNYFELLELEAQGYTALSPELVVYKISRALVDMSLRKEKLFPYTILTKYPISLSRDFWYLFAYEADIYYFGVFDANEKPTGEDAWYLAIKKLTEEGRVERRRVLQEALLAANRNFDKGSAKWFMGLFNALEPSLEEAFQVQHELHAVLALPHSKVVNEALKWLKKLQADKQLDTGLFMDNAGLLLASDVKGVVKTCLMLLDKMAKQHPEHGEAICVLATQAFTHADHELQIRAAKLIAQHAPEDEPAVAQELAMYGGALVTDAQALLERFLPQDAPTQEGGPGLEVHIEAAQEPLEALPPVVNFEDLVFLATQVFESNEPAHFWLFLDGFARLAPTLQGEALGKLEPALQKSCKLVFTHTADGLFKNLLATFFVEYCDAQVKAHPASTGPLKGLLEAYRSKDVANVSGNPLFRDKVSSLKNWQLPNLSPLYALLKQFVLYVQGRVLRHNTTPLLCTPTHAPCWVEANTLVARLRQHQTSQTAIDPVDLQMALARLCEVGVLDVEALGKLKGEAGQLMAYALGQSNDLSGAKSYMQAWLVATVHRKEAIAEKLLGTKHGLWDARLFTGAFEWEVFTETFMTQRYDFEAGKTVPHEEQSTFIKVQHGAEPVLKKSGGLLGKIRKKVARQGAIMASLEAVASIYASCIPWYYGRKRYLATEDTAWALSIMPNNPGPLVITVIDECWTGPTLDSGEAKRRVMDTLEFLAELQQPFAPVVQGFLGMCMMCSDRTAKALAGEIWISGVPHHHFDQARLGQAIAKMNAQEFTPLKRFTELAPTMYAVSAQHRQQMALLLQACIAHLADGPPKNAKRMLELLKETIGNGAALKEDAALVQKLGAWAAASKSLKKLVGELVG